MKSIKERQDTQPNYLKDEQGNWKERASLYELAEAIHYFSNTNTIEEITDYLISRTIAHCFNIALPFFCYAHIDTIFIENHPVSSTLIKFIRNTIFHHSELTEETTTLKIDELINYFKKVNFELTFEQELSIKQLPKNANTRIFSNELSKHIFITQRSFHMYIRKRLFYGMAIANDEMIPDIESTISIKGMIWAHPYSNYPESYEYNYEMQEKIESYPIYGALIYWTEPYIISHVIEEEQSPVIMDRIDFSLGSNGVKHYKKLTLDNFINILRSGIFIATGYKGMDEVSLTADFVERMIYSNKVDYLHSNIGEITGVRIYKKKQSHFNASTRDLRGVDRCIAAFGEALRIFQQNQSVKTVKIALNSITDPQIKKSSNDLYKYYTSGDASSYYCKSDKSFNQKAYDLWSQLQKIEEQRKKT